MKNVLVTGAAGFIGSHVVDNVIGMGFNVIGMDDLSGGFISNVHPECKFIEGSIEDYELIRKLFEKYKFEYVYHLAAYAAEGLSHYIKRYNYQNNLIGSINLINACVNSDSVKCFVFTSSIAVYGRNQIPMTEDMTPSPEDPYGIAKFAVELDLKESKDIFGLNHIIFRPHNVYGERQNLDDKYRNVIGIFMRQIMLNEKMTIFGNGQQTRAFSHIDDVAPVIARSIERYDSYNQIFNIGADKPYTINQLAEETAAAMGVEPDVEYPPARKEVIDAVSSHDKAKKYFGDLMKNVPLDAGLKQMAKWAKKRGINNPKTFEDIEVNRCFPDAWK